MRVTIRPEVREQLRDLCLSDLANGGRGIRNQVEVHLVNPLSRALFEAYGSHFCIDSLEVAGVTTLGLKPAEIPV